MTVALEITATYMAMKGGAFDTRYRYMAKDNVTPDFHMVAGPTLASSPRTSGAIHWRFKFGTLVIDGGATDIAAPAISNSTTGVSV